MNKQELSENLDRIIHNRKKHGLEIYMLLNESGKLKLNKFVCTDLLMERVSKSIDDLIDEKYRKDEIILDDVANISDERKCLYDIPVTEDYDPFSVISNYDEIKEQYDGEKVKNLVGFFFKINYNSEYIWAYQQVYSMNNAKRSKNILAVIGRNKVYDVWDDDLISIASRIDLLIIDQHIITSNIGLMQNKFKFEFYVRKEAKDTVTYIVQTGLLSNVDKLISFISKEKLTNAKKLMKAKNSPILKIEKNNLLDRIRNHSRYKNMIHIENNEIIINSEKDAGQFIKLLNDDIIKSELSDIEYDSSAKKVLNITLM